MTTSKREAPISFRPGKLRTVIRQRAVGSMTEGQVVKRDLGRYYLLIGQALADVRPTRREAVWLNTARTKQEIEEIMSGNPFVPEYMNPSDELLWVIRREISDAVAQGRTPPPAATSLLEKVESMDPVGRAALIDALDRLPQDSEEDVYNADNWTFVGVSFAPDSPATDGRRE